VRGLGVRVGVDGVRKPPRDETARRLRLGVGAMRLWGFESQPLLPNEVIYNGYRHRARATLAQLGRSGTIIAKWGK
jgi:hypothetical protein